jgi:uncharacterized membrane protein YbhN (UPF0104 family)
VNDPSARPAEAPPLWRRVLPIVLAVLLLGYVLSRIDFAAFVHALEPRALVLLVLFALVWNFALLCADAFATSAVYRATVCPVRFRELWLIRGASYLPGLLNHHVGQGWVAYFLSKAYGASLWRVASATLVIYVTTFACLVAFALVALPFEYHALAFLVPVLAPISACGLVFLLLVRTKPRVLQRRRLLSATFDVGVRGHFKHMLLRAPHMFVLFLGSWVPLQLFGVHVPFFEALGLVPPVLLVAALPITPQGVGVRDTLSVQLFAGYAASRPDEAAAHVLASTLGWAVAIVCVQALSSPFLMKRAYALMPKPDADARGQLRPMPE